MVGEAKEGYAHKSVRTMCKEDLNKWKRILCSWIRT